MLKMKNIFCVSKNPKNQKANTKYQPTNKTHKWANNKKNHQKTETKPHQNPQTNLQFTGWMNEHVM